MIMLTPDTVARKNVRFRPYRAVVLEAPPLLYTPLSEIDGEGKRSGRELSRNQGSAKWK